MSRKFLVGGNWKCFGSIQSVTDLAKSIKTGDIPSPDIVDVVVAPAFLHLNVVQEILKDSRIQLSAQNCWYEDKGAFTGEVSPLMLKDFGINWVILGHSERRHVLKESDEVIAKKTQLALKNGLEVIFCVGELLEERENNKTLSVLEHQLSSLKAAISDWTHVVIAYEPVWAIGTGKVASPQQAQEAHEMIRNWLKENVSAETSNSTRILYGGSVKPENCVELAKKQDVDGFLVGGCSLVAENFIDIIRSAEAKKN